jgi:hypothetical protein
VKTSSPYTRQLGLQLPVLIVISIAVVITAVKSNSDIHASAAPTKKGRSKKSPVQFNKDGELARPTGYRKWTYVGTPLTPNDMNGGKTPFSEYHTVYMNPNAHNHYEKTGEFLNGTVLVKELISVDTKEASSSKGNFMGDFAGFEDSMKVKMRFKDEPGNWAHFSFGHKYPLKDVAKAQSAASCNDCHNGETDDDYVFTQYYPVVRAAKSLRSRNVTALLSG